VNDVIHEHGPHPNGPVVDARTTVAASETADDWRRCRPCLRYAQRWLTTVSVCGWFCAPALLATICAASSSATKPLMRVLPAVAVGSATHARLLQTGGRRRFEKLTERICHRLLDVRVSRKNGALLSALPARRKGSNHAALSDTWAIGLPVSPCTWLRYSHKQNSTARTPAPRRLPVRKLAKRLIRRPPHPTRSCWMCIFANACASSVWCSAATHTAAPRKATLDGPQVGCALSCAPVENRAFVRLASKFPHRAGHRLSLG